jgi:hypothetical protein
LWTAIRYSISRKMVGRAVPRSFPFTLPWAWLLLVVNYYYYRHPSLVMLPKKPKPFRRLLLLPRSQNFNDIHKFASLHRRTRRIPTPRLARVPSIGDCGAIDDPGPRGVHVRDYERQLAGKSGGVAPAGWTFDKSDWWLEEHGLIMSTPDALPRKKLDKRTKQVLPFKRYVVTGDREVTTVLTVFDDGTWELLGNAI